ncbi:MAG: acylneuraminate cytidylyltransferase family protein [Chloroflexota bacterium]
MSQTIAFTFARGGSKGVKNKNIRLLNGKPLIAYSLELALTMPTIDRVVVSTDSEQIAEVAREVGAEVPFMRPAHLATDTAPEHMAWQHAVNTLQLADDDIFISLPATSPLRNQQDVQACLDMLQTSQVDMVVTITPSARNPYFNMVKRLPDGQIEKILQGDEIITNRQSAPEFFDLTGLAYICQCGYIRRTMHYSEGRVHAVVVPQTRSLDIDTEFDLKIADLLLRDTTT